MDLLTIFIVIVVVGVLLWLANTYIPMQPSIKKILNIAVVVFLIIFLLKALGAFAWLKGISI